VTEVTALILCALQGHGQQPTDPSAANLLALSLEELSDIRVLSVSREPEALGDAPSSIVVVTNEQIRRSGATSLGEALRLAPNLQVARLNSVGYAITARGFANSLANKLLVLIDGRAVYTPDPAGVSNPTLANDADFRWTLRSSVQLLRGLLLDVGVRRVDSLPDPDVPRYTAVDGHLGWYPGEHCGARLGVRNLFDSAHPEFGAAPNRSELPRSVILSVDWRFGDG
jgi:outer membrane receptor protein involved in Fe transport